MFKNLVDPIVGLIQRTSTYKEYIILNSAFRDERGTLVCTIKSLVSGNEMPYRLDRIVADSKRGQKKTNILEFKKRIKAKDGAKNEYGCRIK